MKEYFEHTFDTVLGHNLPKQLIFKMIEKNRLPNVFLFSGAEGIGKKSLAIAFVKLLNCLEKTAKNGCPCKICRKIREQKTVDIYHLFPSGGLNQISVDEIREFHNHSAIYPVEMNNKVLFIHGADRLSQSAANAILKLLEEPSSHLLIILFTKSLSSVLPTIRSRCTLVRFHPIPIKILIDWLVKETGISEKEAEMVGYFSEGSPKRAIEIISGGLTKKLSSLSEAFKFLFQHGFDSLPATSFKLQNEIKKLEEIFQLSLSWFRDLLLLNFFQQNQGLEKNVPQGILLNVDQMETLNLFFKKIPLHKAFRINEFLIEMSPLITRVVHEDLFLRVMLTEIIQTSNL